MQPSVIAGLSLIPVALASLYTASSSLCPSFSPQSAIAHIRNGAAQACAYRKPIIMVLVVIAAVFAHCYLHKHAERFYHHHTSNQHPHVTVLGATYGGQDVTNRAQAYYNKYGKFRANNDVFGDPIRTVRKHLHVVYQANPSDNGPAEIFSQSFPESSHSYPLTMTQPECHHPATVWVGGNPVQILGALYNNAQATCNVRQMVFSSKFNSFFGYSVRGADFTPLPDANGILTIVYLKNGKLLQQSAKEGTYLIL